MRRTLIFPGLLIAATALSGCGASGPRPPAANANQNISNTAGQSSTTGTGAPGETVPTGPTNTNTGQSAGSGPPNQGIGGGRPVNANSTTLPPGTGNTNK